MKRAAGLLFLAACVAWSQAHSEGIDFVLPSLDGNQHRLSDYRGKWVVVNFWATWCPPCLEEIPMLVEFHERHKARDAIVLGINFEEIDRLLLDAFVEEHGITYPVLLIGEQPLTPFEPLKGLPSTYFVSPDGAPAGRHVGPLTLEMIEDILKRKPRAATSARPGSRADAGRVAVRTGEH